MKKIIYSILTGVGVVYAVMASIILSCWLIVNFTLFAVFLAITILGVLMGLLNYNGRKQR